MYFWGRLYLDHSILPNNDRSLLQELGRRQIYQLSRLSLNEKNTLGAILSERLSTDMDDPYNTSYRNMGGVFFTKKLVWSF